MREIEHYQTESVVREILRMLAIDLFCGLGGWAEGLLATGYTVIGYDITRQRVGDRQYPGHLVLQNVLTLDGATFRDATLIVASPPCQAYSYMVMPWSRARAMRERYQADPVAREQLNTLFDACFRIQAEASTAAGRRIPLIVENVRGAQRWVGRAAGRYGSYYLWGDVPAVLPQPAVGAVKAPGLNWSDRSRLGQDFTRHAAAHAAGRKFGGRWFLRGEYQQPWRAGHSKSDQRRALSAMIAMIPFELASFIGSVYAR